jgi:FkbM family methyltransferase
MIIRFEIEDIDVEIGDDHPFNENYRSRTYSELQFRRINCYLIRMGYIRGNIIDVGAYIGDNSVPWAKMLSKLVYAIDPSDKNCEYMNLLKRLNKLDNLKIMCKAICNKKVIISSDDEMTHCNFKVGDGYKNKILAESFDELYISGELYDIDYIHLDIEGMERFAIEGGNRLISECLPIITFEQHINSEDYFGLSRYIKSMGYRVYMIDEVLAGCFIDCRNFLAIPHRIGDIKLNIENGINMDNILIEI